MTETWAKEAAQRALRFPRPCKCFESDTIAPLPQCRDGLCADAVDRIAQALEAEREACALQVRHDCTACEGSGHMDAETECEYCGRPMAAIRART